MNGVLFRKCSTYDNDQVTAACTSSKPSGHCKVLLLFMSLYYLCYIIIFVFSKAQNAVYTVRAAGTTLCLRNRRNAEHSEPETGTSHSRSKPREYEKLCPVKASPSHQFNPIDPYIEGLLGLSKWTTLGEEVKKRHSMVYFLTLMYISKRLALLG